MSLKKLSLEKETLVSMDSENARQIAGGRPVSEFRYCYQSWELAYCMTQNTDCGICETGTCATCATNCGTCATCNTCATNCGTCATCNTCGGYSCDDCNGTWDRACNYSYPLECQIP